MQKYLVELFVTSAQEQTHAPRWLLRLYLSLFTPPLGKTLRLDMVKKLIQGYDFRNKRILDVGCGIGDLSFLLAERGANVIGVELDATKVAHANDIARRWGFNSLDFFTADVTKLDQMNLGQFDAIFCLALLEHIQDDVSVLKQMQSMLKPDGLFLMEVPSARRNTIPDIEAADGHMRPGYVFEDVPALLSSAGFHLEATRTMDPCGLIYYWCVTARLIPHPKVQRWMFVAVAPLFIALIRLTSRFIHRVGAELCFLAVKDTPPAQANHE
jgi:SAM-dependent methyltransferase